MQRRSVLTTLLLALFAPLLRLFRRAPKDAEYVDIGTVKDFDSNEPFSVSMWFKTKTPVKGVRLQPKSGGPGLAIKVDDTKQDGKWHTFACDYDGTSGGGLRLFVDGIEVNGDRSVVYLPTQPGRPVRVS